MKKKIGLYFGTFNPVHVGHLMIANYMAEFTDLEEIWLVVTPHNPFKKKSSLLDNYQRLDMVYRATESYTKLKPSKVEFDLPQPNYTYYTLAVLQEAHPEKAFSLIMGEDNLGSFHKWKNHETIITNHEIYVYPRIGSQENNGLKDNDKIHFVSAPIVEISSSFIRRAIKEDKNIRPFLPLEVWKYLDENNFYR